MPRRRARRQEPVEEDEDDDQNHAPEEEPSSPRSSQLPDPTHEFAAPKQDNSQGLPRLQFDEELSWRPAQPIASALLIDRLERLSKELADFDQGEVELGSLKDVAASLAHRNLIQHKDRGVKAYTACCLVDILRLFVPEAPFTGDQLKVACPALPSPCPLPAR